MQKIIKFKINELVPPKPKLTKNQQWTDKAQHYAKFKSLVVKEFYKAVQNDPEFYKMCQTFEISKQKGRKTINNHPLTTSKKNQCFMFCNFDFGKIGQRGDPENCFGTIADSLFDQDKFLGGTFLFKNTNNLPSVEILVIYNY